MRHGFTARRYKKFSDLSSPLLFWVGEAVSELRLTMRRLDRDRGWKPNTQQKLTAHKDNPRQPLLFLTTILTMWSALLTMLGCSAFLAVHAVPPYESTLMARDASVDNIVYITNADKFW